MPDLAPPEESSAQTAVDQMLARAGAKDRTHIQRHLAALDAEPDAAHGALWRRLAGTLATLAPLPIQTVGHSAVLFYVPDGKYRMQVFALEDQGDGRVAVYLPDVLDDAIKKKVLRKGDDSSEFPIVGSLRNTLKLEVLDAQNTPEPPAHVKNMLGWNRKSIRVTLPAIGAEGPRVDATEALASLAAKQWEGKQAPVPAVAPAEPPAAPTPRAPRREGPKKRTA
ncbi:MAG TPA: hypothetical protein VN541_09475 [Tepidisphaeraceae bacterium]|nr:hypothetical protein [Tepidisphaeraceae bacterium]